MGTLEVFSLDRLLASPDLRAEWERIIGSNRDVYYTLKYLHATRSCEEGPLLLALFRAEAGQVVYPFVKRGLEDLPLPHRLASGRFDIITPYEYGGPYVVASPSGQCEIIREFSTAFAAYCGDERIVCEFVRFHPLLRIHEDWEETYDLLRGRKNVVIDLSQRIEDIQGGYTKTNIKNIKIAEKNAVRVRKVQERQSWAENFREIYIDTMTRLNAGSFYFFSLDYFESLAGIGSDLISVYEARDRDGRLLSAAVILHGSQLAHYHLSAVTPFGRKFCPNNLLLHQVVVDMKKSGRRYLHLGGTSEIQKGLRTFKERFSPNRIEYVVGKRIHDEGTYDSLVRARQSRGNGIQSSNEAFFPAYRA